MNDIEQQTALAEWLRTGCGYVDARVLADGSVAAILDLLTTRAIVLGCTRYSWERRFCFVDRALADRRFGELQSEEDEPAGYITCRPPKINPICAWPFPPESAADSEGGEV